MNIPGFTASYSGTSQPSWHQRGSLSATMSDQALVAPAEFKVLIMGHVGYCCTCSGSEQRGTYGCDCKACMSI